MIDIQLIFYLKIILIWIKLNIAS